MEDVDGYVLAESIDAQTVIDAGDLRIDGGQTSGTESNTVTYVNSATQVSYQRTYSYTWSTTNGIISSELSISDPF